MILKWLQSITRIKSSGSLLDKRPIAGEQNLLDVAHEVLLSESYARQERLRGLERYGWPLMKKRRLKEKIRAKIRHCLHLSVSKADEFDLLEEVTEKISEAAEADPYYNRVFGDSEKGI